MFVTDRTQLEGQLCETSTNIGFTVKVADRINPETPPGGNSLKELLKDHPDWLYTPSDSKSLSEAIEKRLSDLSTGYPIPPTWFDLAGTLENIMLKLMKLSNPRLTSI